MAPLASWGRVALAAALAASMCTEHMAAAVKSDNIKYHEGLSREDKWKAVGHKGITLWMTGLSGSGKSTVSVALEQALVTNQPRPYFV
eukprot:CAMPEP_0194763244 /NCGR_PEP_ID=MMETSP0323_2-20130528/18625_1 /TAXON_ID=2866 ORGANISM="Crypthecodinium cohnii, Strain Seligo" /NCGR_SAMPLE_ID=MMETSP0323_2 /ASSEMBLY_ACC=CAM_ASM_000346 /LENGTH=87 /DNA_ID=CAMNT_0039687583 /DNA_START=28 /DNA_END=287 /DNA_ORIENTATION=+